jgi:hypothetical protein
MFPFAQSLRNFFRADRLRTRRPGRPRRTHLAVENLEERSLLSTCVLTGQDPGAAVLVTQQGYGSKVSGISFAEPIAGCSALEIHGSGSNPINVEGTAPGVPVSIFLKTGDTVTISGQAHDLSNIQSPVMVNGNGQDSTLTVDDQAAPSGFLGTGYTVSSTQLTRTNGVHPATVINYSALHGFTLNTSNNGDIDSIDSIPAPTVVNGGAGLSVVFVSPTGKNLDGIGSLTIHGGTGGAAVTVHDEANPHVGSFPNLYDIESTGLTRTAPPLLPGQTPFFASITYDHLTSLTLDTSNVFFSAVAVSPTAKNLDGIGSVTIHGGTGGAAATVHDEANPHVGFLPNIYDIASTGLTRTAPPLLPGQTPFVASISYDHLTSLTLDTGNLVNVETVQSTATGTPVTINGGTGANAFTVGDKSSVKNILGPVTIKGSGANSTLLVDDAGAATQDKVTVTPAQLGTAADQFFGSGGSLSYGGLGSLTLNLSNAFDDSVGLTPSASTAFAVNGSQAAFQAGHGAALTVDVTGTTSPTNTPSGPGAGKFTFGNRQAVTYTNIAQTVTAGTPAAVTAGPANLGSQLTLRVGPLTPLGKHRRKVGGRFQQTVSLINTGPDAIKGPFALVLDSLAPRKKSHRRLVAQVTVLNASGTSRSVSVGSPYVAAGAPQLQPGDQLTFVLNFKLKAGGRITFNPIPLAGFAQP